MKLSEIPGDTMLSVDMPGEDLGFMTKESFLESATYLDMQADDKKSIPVVTTATPQHLVFSITEALEQFVDDEGYEDMSNHLSMALTGDEVEIIKMAQNAIDRVLNKFPVYWEGKKVEIDTMP